MFMNLLVDRWIKVPPIQSPYQQLKASRPGFLPPAVA